MRANYQQVLFSGLISAPYSTFFVDSGVCILRFLLAGQSTAAANVRRGAILLLSLKSHVNIWQSLSKPLKS